MNRLLRLQLVALSDISAIIALEPSSLELPAFEAPQKIIRRGAQGRGWDHAVRGSHREQRGRVGCTQRPFIVRTGQRRAQTGREASWAAIASVVIRNLSGCLLKEAGGVGSAEAVKGKRGFPHCPSTP